MKKYLLLLAMGSMVCMAAEESVLITAVKKGDLQAAEKAIKKGAAVDGQEREGEYWTETPLMIAAEKRLIPMMQLLIKAGADVSAVVGSDFPHAGSPVLRYAIESGSPEAVRMLIKAGAKIDVNTENGIIHHWRSGRTVRNIPLLSSAIKSRAPIEVIDELIAGGADVNLIDMFKVGWTPLMIAAYTGYTDAVKKLLAAGADKTLKHKKDGGRTAIDYAYEQGHKEIVALLQDEKNHPSRWTWLKGWLGW